MTLVVNRNNTATLGTGILFFLHFHEFFQTKLTDKFTVFHKACPISFVITFFHVFNPFTGIIGTFKTIRQLFDLDTILYFTLTAMLWFSLITI